MAIPYLGILNKSMEEIRESRRQYDEWRAVIVKLVSDTRQEKNDSLRTVARYLSVSHSFLNDCELGRRHPSYDVCVKMVEYCGFGVKS